MRMSLDLLFDVVEEKNMKQKIAKEKMTSEQQQKEQLSPQDFPTMTAILSHLENTLKTVSEMQSELEKECQAMETKIMSLKTWLSCSAQINNPVSLPLLYHTLQEDLENLQTHITQMSRRYARRSSLQDHNVPILPPPIKPLL